MLLYLNTQQPEPKLAIRKIKNKSFLWTDENIIIFLRKNLPRKDFSCAKDVYHTLIEIDCRFYNRSRAIVMPGIINLAVEYSGHSKMYVERGLHILKKCNLIDYERVRRNGKVIGSYLYLFEFISDEYHLACYEEKEVKMSQENKDEKVKTLRLHRPKSRANDLIISTNIVEASSKVDNLSSENFVSDASHPRKDSLEESISAKLRRTIESRQKESKGSINKLDKIPEDVETYFDYWKDLGLHVSRVDTKITREAVRIIRSLLRGTFFNKYSNYQDYHNRKFGEDEIKLTFEKFALAALDKDYFPIPGPYKAILTKTTIDKFFYSPFSKKNISLFLHYLETDVGKIPIEEEDKWPEAKLKLMSLYREKILGRADVKLDEAKFRKAANRLKEFRDKNRSRLFFASTEGPLVLPSLLMEAILENVHGETSKISPGWLSSDTTFSFRLPSYLSYQGYLYSEGITTYSDDIDFDDYMDRLGDL